MADSDSFAQLIARVRAGDEQACAELVAQYGPIILRMARNRLGHPALRASLDVEDAFQSSLRSFFVRAGLGQYELQTPADLVALLSTMVTHRIAEYTRRPYHQRRRKLPADVVDPTTSMPEQALIRQEEWEEVKRRLSPAEWRLVQMRKEGLSWDAIAAAVGGSAEQLRQMHHRAIKRIAQELKLDEADDE